MPIIKSAKKRVRQTNTAKKRNDITRKNLRIAIKKLQASLSAKKNTEQSLKDAQSNIDKAVKKGLMHKNKAARKKRQLASAVKLSGAKIVKTTVAKAAAKPKKTTAKKSSK